MKVKFILPALTEACGPYWRSIKYSLFPPLGLATLAGYLDDRDEAAIQDEHVEKIDLNDRPDVAAIQVYITNAKRAYEIADHYRRQGVYVVLGGLHITALPFEALRHADTLVLGPAEEAWPRFLADYRAGHPARIYRSQKRSLTGEPRPRRDLIQRHLYLAPNSIIISRGCPHQCDFCYKESFFEGGRSFYRRMVDEALAEIEALPGRHLFFLDDHLFGEPRFAAALFDGMRGMGRVWQAAGTVAATLKPGLLEKAADSGLRSLFVGFETLSAVNLAKQGKRHNLGLDYSRAIGRMRDLGVMVNGSFVFGMDDDDEDVFERTIEWAVSAGIETATFHILTPYPGTALHRRMVAERRLLHSDWDNYDTRHAVFQPARMTPQALEDGYWWAYETFYSWGSILKSAGTKQGAVGKLRHMAYTGGWKKVEPLWEVIIRAGQVTRTLPFLEMVLAGGRGEKKARADSVIDVSVT
jgi:radical SAM superfamily enzyme YgiQ (UPF0313 family)